MTNLQLRLQDTSAPLGIRIELVDESGNHLDPREITPLDYLSRFLHKCVVNKVYRDMIARKKTGTIEVYQDKIIIKEN
jgi:hypothetical protein